MWMQVRFKMQSRRNRVLLQAPCAHIAQSVEHFLGKEEVTGSIPVVGTTCFGV